MKITKVETIRLAEFGNLIWVRLHTDEGLVGLGGSMVGSPASSAPMGRSSCIGGPEWTA